MTIRSVFQNSVTIYKMVIAISSYIASSVHAQVCSYLKIVTTCMGLQNQLAMWALKITISSSFLYHNVITNTTKCLSLMHNLMAILLQLTETGYLSELKI